MTNPDADRKSLIHILWEYLSVLSSDHSVLIVPQSKNLSEEKSPEENSREEKLKEEKLPEDI